MSLGFLRRRWWSATPTKVEIPCSDVELNEVDLYLPTIRAVRGAACLRGVGDVDAFDLILAGPGVCQPPERDVAARHRVDGEDLEWDGRLSALASLESVQRSEGRVAEWDAGQEVDAVRVVYEVDGEDVGGECVAEGRVDEQGEAVNEVVCVG